MAERSQSPSIRRVDSGSTAPSLSGQKSRRRSSRSSSKTESSNGSRGSSRSRSKSQGRSGNSKKKKENHFLSFEFVIYAIHLMVFFLYVVPLYGGTVKQKCEGYYGCSRYIKRTVFGYNIDLADGQWRDMRGNFLLLWATLLLTTAGHWFCSKVWNMRKPNSTIADMATVSAIFRLIVGAIFLYVLHGRHGLIVALLAYIGYRITKWQQEAGSFSGFYSWVFALVIILFKESYRIMHLPGMAFLRPLFNHDQYGGMYRWQLPANFLVLRILSYSMDFLWAAKEEQALVTIKKTTRSSKKDKDKDKDNDNDKDNDKGKLSSEEELEQAVAPSKVLTRRISPTMLGK